MSHSNYKGASTLFDGRVNAELEAGNEGFTALEAKTLHRVKFASHESTPLMGPVKARVHVDSLFLAWLSELDLLKLVADPIANYTVFNVHELNTNFLAVCLAVSRNQISKNPLWFSLCNSAIVRHLDAHLFVHISFSEAIVMRVKQ